MKEIDVAELSAWRSEGKPHQLIDVREPHEFEAGNLGGEPIPMGDIMERVHDLKTDIPVVMQCRSGGRSGAVVTALETKFGMENLYNLRGGAQAWATQVDPSMEVA